MEEAKASSNAQHDVNSRDTRERAKPDRRLFSAGAQQPFRERAPLKQFEDEAERMLRVWVAIFAPAKQSYKSSVLVS
jgi:hypothetical protein